MGRILEMDLDLGNPLLKKKLKNLQRLRNPSV
ncbi:conserved hypothetical protein [Pseudomonas sp. 9Ag]|nr:conserved hypothetical protein [Pseudomonas sp. 9Ag]